MILTIQEAADYRNGTINKRLFNKLMSVVDFENYLFRYCRIIEDVRNEENNIRYTTFSIFNYHATVIMQNGEFVKISYKKI
jgi:hypothetical protein